jgi:hypothetical protein
MPSMRAAMAQRAGAAAAAAAASSRPGTTDGTGRGRVQQQQPPSSSLPQPRPSSQTGGARGHSAPQQGPQGDGGVACLLASSSRALSLSRAAQPPPSAASPPPLAPLVLGPGDVCLTRLEKNKLKRGLRRGDPPVMTTYESRQVFRFDAAHPPSATTLDLFLADVAPALAPVLRLDGSTAAVLAYGQTGSGKTFTMAGGGGEAGLMQCCCLVLLDAVAQADAANAQPTHPHPHARRRKPLAVFVTAGEIYQEQLLDLCAPPGKPKRLTPSTLRRVRVRSAPECIAAVEEAAEQRASGATNLNEESSRSHAVYVVSVEEEGEGGAGGGGGGEAEGGRILGTLALVDLAGAEYAAATEGRDDARRLEGSKNNLGLMSLKAALRWLGERRRREMGEGAAGGDGAPAPAPAPFTWQQSALTRLLRPFLAPPGEEGSGWGGGGGGGGGRAGSKSVVLLVTVSPEPSDAYQSSLALQDGLRLTGREGDEKEVREVVPVDTGAGGGAGGGGGGGGGAGSVRRRPILLAGSGTAGGRAGAARLAR